MDAQELVAKIATQFEQAVEQHETQIKDMQEQYETLVAESTARMEAMIGGTTTPQDAPPAGKITKIETDDGETHYVFNQQAFDNNSAIMDGMAEVLKEL
jgi:hypothetical protein